MTEFKCEACDKEFSSKEALDMHNGSKHYSPPKISVNKKKVRNYGIWIVILVLVVGGGYYLTQGVINEGNSCQTDPAAEINIGGHNNLVSHIHANLDIMIDGTKEQIPSNIGIGAGIMRPVHTHDSSGELHIEGPCVRDFTLGDFFSIYEETFNSECIFDNCDGEVTLTVNGATSEDYENHVLRDGQDIVISYTSN
jgi:hypothetical protein